MAKQKKVVKNLRNCGKALESVAKHSKAGKLLTSILSAFGQLLYVQPATVKKQDCNENKIKVVSNNKYNFAHNTN